MLFRNRHLVRAVACFLLVETLTAIALPSISWAMMGPGQPEFTSYEAPGATDLVNLTTGDFSYSIPVLDVPGPERSFSLPLSYKSGIQLEQEASWVGLGWSLNAGAITRTVNGYADDAAGESTNSVFSKEIDTQDRSVVIPGIYTQTSSKYNGSGGTVDLLGLAGVNWDKNGLAGGDLVGIGYQKGQGLTGDPVRFTMAVVTIATLGGGSAASVAGKLGLGLVESSASSLAMGALGLGRLGGTSGYNNQLIDHTTGDYFESERKLFFLNTSNESEYGSLYFGRMSQQVNGPYNDAARSSGPTITSGGVGRQAPQFNASRRCDGDNFGNSAGETAADIYLPVGTTNLYSNDLLNPLSIAHDYFSVMGEAASGTIRPYRLEVGSVAYPKIGLDDCHKHAKYMTVPFKNDYKVGFRYENSPSNGYDYHQNGQDIGFQVSADKQSINITDKRLFDESTRIEGRRKGLVNQGLGDQQFVQGKHTVWYSNTEIEQMTGTPFVGYPNGFVEFEQPTASAGTGNAFRHQLPPDGIGAFAVTTEDGSTYHYSLPVYQFNAYSLAQEQQLPSTVGGLGYYRTDTPGYATTWLLTAITSPDYVDRNSSGTVDEADWGGWVRFSYGKFSANYTWRQPYIGTTYADNKTPIEYESYSTGTRENYYLNSISTRTHTALFIKSIREDGRGVGSVIVQRTGAYVDLASSLRLDEIVLLDNATLRQLQTPNGIRADNDATPVPALTVNTNADQYASGADLGKVFDGQDISSDLRIKQFIESNAIKRVHFNYGYDLCRGTPNSFAFDYDLSSELQTHNLPPMDEAHASVNRNGKLTLKSVSFFGPTVDQKQTKIIPDFTFGYEVSGRSVSETNPSYGKEKWDAFGMYKSLGEHDVSSHKPDPVAYGAPWTLTTITSPTGGVTTVAYERDQYAHVSDYGAKKVIFSSDGSNTLTLSAADLAKFGGNLTEAVQPGDFLEFTGSVYYLCANQSPNGGPTAYKQTAIYTNERRKVSSVAPGSIVLTEGFISSSSCGQWGRGPGTPYGILEAPLPSNIAGGDVRVAAITSSDGIDGARYQVRYKYTDGTGRACNSTGVLTKEPSFLEKANHSTDKQFDYPTTPVLYGQVTVLRGPFRNNVESSFNSREVYSFFTPTSSMVTENRTGSATRDVWNPGDQKHNTEVNFFNNQVVVNTGLIGRPKSIRTYNQQGQQELSTEFTYSDQILNNIGLAGQGHYSEGVLANEQLDYDSFKSYHVNRTTKEYVPAVLVGSTSTRNGLSIANRNVLYDFYTGQVLETAFTNSLGKVYHSRSVPAYTLPGNEGMGAKGDNPGNRHMLAQQGASYTYTEVPGGPAYDPLNPLDPQTSHVLSAGVQTWQSGWANYREADATGAYRDMAGQTPVWRQAAAYAWQAPQLAADGSFQGFVPFNWAGAPDAHWLKAGETVRYDHYSHALETRDVNGQSAAQKTGYGQTQLVASAANARYTELAYSGAEDPLTVGGTAQFGGEVVAGGTLDNTTAHTGFFSNQLAAGQKGFVYRAQAGRDVDPGKTYRVTAWVSATAPAGRLYVAVNGSRLPESAFANQSRKKAGAWALLSLLVTVPASAGGQPVEFGCVNDGAAPANFDDFRVAPLAATVSSKVYDPRTNNLLYSLDNDNLYTRYEYTPTGRLRRVYQETLDRSGDTSLPEKKVKEYDYNFARLYFPTWLSVAYRCQTDAHGNNTGTEERQVVDGNPLNTPPAPARWEANGASAACASPACADTEAQPYKLINNACEAARAVDTQDFYDCVTNGKRGVYTVTHWVYSDGTKTTTRTPCSTQL